MDWNSYTLLCKQPIKQTAKWDWFVYVLTAEHESYADLLECRVALLFPQFIAAQLPPLPVGIFRTYWENILVCKQNINSVIVNAVYGGQPLLWQQFLFPPDPDISNVILILVFCDSAWQGEAMEFWTLLDWLQTASSSQRYSWLAVSYYSNKLYCKLFNWLLKYICENKLYSYSHIIVLARRYVGTISKFILKR